MIIAKNTVIDRAMAIIAPVAFCVPELYNNKGKIQLS